MSREEVITNLGTIAKSGTREFFSKLSGDQQKDASLIGQFGVGFYSSFIVADKVTVLTRRAGPSRTRACAGNRKAPANSASRWSTARPRHRDHPAPARRPGRPAVRPGSCASIIRKYSDHIVQPIVMKKEKWDDEKKEQVATDEDETVNQASALWTRPKNDISDEQYKEFYKHVGHDFEDPLAWTHARVEGKTEYTQLLYVPARAPFDLWDRNAKHGIKLYVRRVFIMDDAEQLMPTYLRFVRGVVDSNDLPLNVSREILQESKDIEAIRKGCTAKVLGMLETWPPERKKEKYAKFWGEFGKVLKEGIGEDFANKEKIAGLLRFASTHADTADETVSLADYIGRMKEAGKDLLRHRRDLQRAKNSPHLEVFRKKGIEVMLLSDRVDEWVVSHLTEFDGKQLVSVAKGGLDLGKLEDEAEKKEQESAAGEFKDLVEKIAKSLGERSRKCASRIA
jgi:molecular chaperone HtpG